MHKADPFMTLVAAFGSYKIPLSEKSFPDRFTPEYIARKKEQYVKLGQMRDWHREMELKLTDSETAIFDMTKLRYIDPASVPVGLTYFCTLDGAFSEKDAADKSAFTVLGIDSDGNWYVWSYAMRATPQEVIHKLFELHSQFGFNEVGIEKGAFLLSMKVEVDRLQLDYQQYFSVAELSTTGSKISRMKALTPVINSGRLTVVDTGEDAEELVEQIELTDDTGCAAKHDDNLDSMCQLLQMNLYYSEDSNYSPTREDYERDMNVTKKDGMSEWLTEL